VTEILAIYDNPEFGDRYSVVLSSRTMVDPKEHDKLRDCLAVGDDVTHPQNGFSQMTVAELGPHLGKPIRFEDLPRPVQDHVMERIGA